MNTRKTDALWNHLFPNGHRHMVQLKKKYKISERSKLNEDSSEYNIEKMELIKSEDPLIIIDTALMSGMDCFVVGVAAGKGCKSDKYIDKVEKCYINHEFIFRNFKRKGENHSHEGYYSEMGVYKSNGEYISFVGKKDKISEVNVGSGFMDVEYKEGVDAFGKLAHDAREPFGLLINCFYGGGKKRKKNHGNNIINSESKNGMLTGCFFVPWHYDDGDGDYGITCCSNINCSKRSKSFFCICDYNIKISMDICNSWCFFGGRVKHGTSRSDNLLKIKNKNAIYLTTKRNIEEVQEYINISWGQYTRAPAEVVYHRNIARRNNHQLAVDSNDVRGRRLTQYTLGRVNRGINNYELILLRNGQNGNNNNNNSNNQSSSSSSSSNGGRKRTRK